MLTKTKPRIRVSTRTRSSYLTSLPFISKAGHRYAALISNDIIRKKGCIAALDEALEYYGREAQGLNEIMKLETCEHLTKVKMQLTT